jgi:hypothetical protein
MNVKALKVIVELNIDELNTLIVALECLMADDVNNKCEEDLHDKLNSFEARLHELNYT